MISKYYILVISHPLQVPTVRSTIFKIVFIIFLFSRAFSVQAEEVLVVTWRGKTSAEHGFETRLKKLRPGTTFTYIDAQRNKSRLNFLLKNIKLSEVDLVYSFGTVASQIVKKFLNGKKPQVFNIVSTPVKAKIVNSLNKPGNNITGAKVLVDIKTQLNFLLKLRKIKTIGVWFDPREPQSIAVLVNIGKFAKANGITVMPERIIPDAKQKQFEILIKSALTKTSKLDLLYITPTSSFFAIRDKYFSKLKPSLLIMSGVEGFVGKGATLALAANYQERGNAVAELAHKILSGTPAGDIPIDQVTEKSAYLYVDKKRIEQANLKKIYNLGFKIIEK